MTDEAKDVEVDLDASMRETLKEIQEREPETEPEAEATPEPEETQEQRDARARDDKGRFAKKSEKAEPEVTEPEAETPQEAEPEAPAITAKRPPSTWTAKAKAEFDKLPALIQDEVLKREADIGKGIAQYKQYAEYGQALHQVIAPYQQYIQQAGSTPERAIANLLDTAIRLRSGTPQQKGQMVMAIAQQYGADLSAYLGGEQQQAHPTALALNEHLAPLAQKVQYLESTLMSERQRQEQMAMSDAAKRINDFQNAVDESGKPKNLYFDNVREQMAHLIEMAAKSGQDMPIEQAYEAACWSHPEIRPLLLASQQATEQARREAEAKKKAAEARRAAGVNLSTKGAPPATNVAKTGTLDDTMRQTLSRIKSRDAA